MDWALAIDRNRAALLRIVDMLFALAGLEGGAKATLPRHLAAHLQRILRPAESATRRLIVIAAHSVATIHPPFGAFLYGLDGNTAQGRRPVAQRDDSDSAEPRDATFQLADPVKRFSFDPPKTRPRSFPRITCIGLSEPLPLPPAPGPDDPVDAGSLCRRLLALKQALDDIDGQARRLMRWQARRERAFSSPARRSPMRNGPPPGRRKRPVHEIDAILKELHSLALYALLPPDTS